MKRSEVVKQLGNLIRHYKEKLVPILTDMPESFADTLISDLENPNGMLPPLNPHTGKHEWEPEDEAV